MSDRYRGFTSLPDQPVLVKNLGLPNPTKLERYTAARRWSTGRSSRAGRPGWPSRCPGSLDVLGIASTAQFADDQPTRAGLRRDWHQGPPSCTRP
jgi:3-oxoacyl-[acyl-carrier protein] reductase